MDRGGGEEGIVLRGRGQVHFRMTGISCRGVLLVPYKIPRGRWIPPVLMLLEP